MSHRTTSQRQHLFSQQTSFDLTTNKKKQQPFSPHQLPPPLPSTQRKPLTYPTDTLTAHKPTSYTGNPLIPQASRHRQILTKLSQTQEKLVLSEKRYGELWRRYELVCESGRKGGRGDGEEVVIERLRGQLQQKMQQLKQKEQQLKEKNLMIQEKNGMIQRLQSQSHHTNQSHTQSCERIIRTLQTQLQSLHKDLTLKQHQLSTLQRSLYTSACLSAQKLSPSSPHHLHTQLTRLHKEKLTLIADYEQRITQLQREREYQLQTCRFEARKEVEREVGRLVEERVERQEEQTQWMQERRRLEGEVDRVREQRGKELVQREMLKVENLQLRGKLDRLLAQQRFKSDKQHQYRQSHSSPLTPNPPSQLKQLHQQLQSIRKEFSLLKNELHQKQQQIQNSTKEKEALTKEIRRLQQVVRENEDELIERDRRVKEVNELMLRKMAVIEEERQQMQRQLLTERLETMSLTQQLQQQQHTLHRQYQLSLQNLRSQLSTKISQANQQKQQQTQEKQQIYKQMKELQRKYELLASQMLTVGDMMSIATKVHKRHGRFVKENKGEGSGVGRRGDGGVGGRG